jgi:hypothetical protein
MTDEDGKQVLSQDDIDALISGNTRASDPTPASPAAPTETPAPAQTAPPVEPQVQAAGPQPPQPTPAASPRSPPPPGAPPAAVSSTTDASLAEIVQRIENLEQTAASAGGSEAARLLQGHIDSLIKDFRELSSGIDRIQQDLVGTAGFRLRKTFACEQCGVKANVAARIMCTHCGHESWWGWWPE